MMDPPKFWEIVNSSGRRARAVERRPGFQYVASEVYRQMTDEGIPESDAGSGPMEPAGGSGQREEAPPLGFRWQRRRLLR